MNYRIVYCFALILLAIIPGCKKDETTVNTQGESTLSTRLYGTGPYYTYGFSFATGKNIRYPGNGSTRVDLVAQSITDPSNNIIGVVLTSPDNDHAFMVTGKYEDSDTALQAFNNYTSVADGSFSALSDTLTVNEILTFRAVNKTYAKMLITALAKYPDSLTDEYLEIKFRWSYQPDSTTVFP